MPNIKRLTCITAALLCAGAVFGREPQITVHNNQLFSWRQPVCVHLPGTNEGHAVQRMGDDVLFVADMGASSTRTFPLAADPGPEPQSLLKVKPENHGVDLEYKGRNVGRLEWCLVLHPVKKGETNASEDFAASFQSLPLAFHENATGPVFSRWTASKTNAGVALQIELLSYSDGFLDINASVTNRSADPDAKVYAAVVCRWEGPLSGNQLACYDNRLLDLAPSDRTPFRSGPGRYQFVQRGLDWAELTFKDGMNAEWLNDFAPSFTVVDNTTNNPLHAPRYAGANLSQLGQEMQTAPGAILSITEIARSNTRTFADRLTENVLPPLGEGVFFSSRVIFGKSGATDQQFIAYAGYSEQQTNAMGASISFGVPSIRFGTSYFPYSTLGENFDAIKLPGMDRESFWPLAADTVLQWPLFADDIRRDLAIAKAMGFQLIRLHHLELLAPIPAETRRQYLDFLFGELRRLHLKATLDIYASPQQLKALVSRYRDVVDTVELENEILIWGIPLDRPPQWNADYAAVKEASPDALVALTGYNNTGMFNRLRQLGVKFDCVDLHSYIDSVDAIPSGRGYALALGSYARKSGKRPIITEWNWRALTKMSEEDRADIYPPIIENALATRSVKDFYEFQFNETLAPNPRLGRGNLLRHYELLNLSRRPKREAFELMKLIQRYTAGNGPVRMLESSHEAVDASADGTAHLSIAITNASAAGLDLRATAENFGGLTLNLRTTSDVHLAPGATAQIPLDVIITNRLPGFYHVFVRLESNDGFLRYLWAEVRLPGSPRMEPGPEQFDLSRPVYVAYGDKASVLEVETAFAIGQTLESATGMVVPIVPVTDVPDALNAHVIFVGLTKGAPAPPKDWLIITGKNTRDVENAGMSFVLRYWKFAKDSAARRVGVVRKDLPRGGDAAKLP